MSEFTDMKLAEGFEPTGYDAWRALVETSLKGRDFDKALTSETYDGIQLRPLYTSSDMPTHPLRPTSGRGGQAVGWDIRQAATGPSAEDTAAQIAVDLNEGATSVLIRLDNALRSGGTPDSSPDLIGADGAALHTKEAFATAFQGIDLTTTPVALDAGLAGMAAAKALAALAGAGGLASGASLGLDPLSALALTGLDADLTPAWCAAAAAVDGADNAFLMTASSAAFFDAGASEAEELGCLIASGVAYLRGLEAAGMDVTAAARRISFNLALSQDQFQTIAKARAARALWAMVLRATGVDGVGMRLDGVTAERMFARQDPHVNVLRATIAGFAGAVGGLDGLTILPFDARNGGRGPLARRVARNLQIVLAEESNLAKVADPSGGSFFVERLTQDLAKAGWAMFQEIERAGGMAAAIQDGMLPARIRETAAERAKNAAKRREAIIGVSEYANLDEQPLETVDLKSAAAAASADWRRGAKLLDTAMASGEGRLTLQPVAGPYEALRDASNAYADSNGAGPAVFLANIGALAAFTARATFASNAFAAGGLIAKGDVGFADGAAAASAFVASGARIACICGADDGYAAHAADMARALKAAGAGQVWLAGRPPKDRAAFDAAGIDDYVFMGVDLMAALKSAHQAIGV